MPRPSVEIASMAQIAVSKGKNAYSAPNFGDMRGAQNLGRTIHEQAFEDIPKNSRGDVQHCFNLGEQPEQQSFAFARGNIAFKYVKVKLFLFVNYNIGIDIISLKKSLSP